MENPAKVLVVDDKDYIRELLTVALGLKGYEVLVAGGGVDGLTLARRELPRVILLDLLMPRLDGYGVLRELRSDPRTAAVPVIVMSAHAGSDEGVLPAGAQKFLLKPFDLDEMEALVDKYAGPASGKVNGTLKRDNTHLSCFRHTCRGAGDQRGDHNLGALSSARSGADAVNQTLAGMDRIRMTSEQAADRVRELGRQSRQIGEILQIISDIADQTNLLALNAAIEAQGS